MLRAPAKLTKRLNSSFTLAERQTRDQAPLRIHREGWPFIAVFAATNALLLAWSPWPSALFLPLTLWCVAICRDPDRRTPRGPGLVVSPADGRLLPVTRGIPPTELGLGLEPRQRLSVFMSVFNV